MRISTGQIFQQGVTSMLNTQSELAKTQQQLATGKRILAPSDDPAASAQIMQLDQIVEATDQFQRNADFVDSRLGLEESVLIDAGNILQRVRELAVRANNDTLSAGDRGAIAAEIKGSLEDLFQLANTQDSSGEYLFAGFQTGTQPFTTNGAVSFAYVGDQGQREIQVGANRTVKAGDSGDVVFMRVDDGLGGVNSVFDTLNEFVNDLEANNPSTSTLTKIDSAMDQMLTVRASIGARMNSVENQRNANDTFSLLLQENLSELKDLDYADAVSRFEQQMLALQAAQQSFIKIEGLSLFNYL